MALKHRLQNLEKSHDSYRRVYVIALESDESIEDATRRFCDEEDTTVDEFENRPTGSLAVFLRDDFGD